MTLTMNLTDVEAWAAGDILPPGSHYVEVASAEEGTSSGGNPELVLELHAVGGEFAGASIRDWIHFTPNTAGKVKQVLDAFGLDSTGEVSVEASTFVGKRAKILVREEPYDGKPRSKVKAYEASSGPAESNGNGFGSAKSDKDDLPF